MTLERSGIGFSLFISKKICEYFAQKSSITISSDLNKGSEFHFEIVENHQNS